MPAHSIVSYTGSTPGNDSNTYNLFSTLAGSSNDRWPKNAFALMGVKKLTLVLKCNQAGTLKAYESTDRGTNWRQIDEIAVAAPAANASYATDYSVEGLADFKLDWVNGGTIQSPWDVSMSLSEQRASPL